MPTLADGTELLGRHSGSGHRDAPYLLRRADGRAVEVSPLLYHVVAHVDGRRDLSQIAAQVASSAGRKVSAENVSFLIEHKLRPLGVMADAGGERLPSPVPRPLLSVVLRTGVVPPRLVRAATALFLPLFRRPVVLSVLVGVAATDFRLLRAHAVTPALAELLHQPGLLLVVFALTIVAAAFHELGHATGCRYGGAEPGGIGVGLYVIWPVFYNDLNDSYRLGKAGRLRADLGGVYFNAVFILAVAVAYSFSQFQPLLVVIVAQHLAILQQFVPFLRLDGYYVVSDLVGVPDLFGHIKPTLSSLLPRRRAHPAVPRLRRRVRVVVTAWVLLTAAVLAASVVALVVRAPHLVLTAWDSLGAHVGLLAAAMQEGDAVDAAVAGVQVMALLFPAAGMTVLALRLARRLLPARPGQPAK